MKEIQKPESDFKKFVDELIQERSFTMEDGRARGETKLPVVQKPEPKPSVDNGDLL
jgi:hypothetical protein